MSDRAAALLGRDAADLRSLRFQYFERIQGDIIFASYSASPGRRDIPDVRVVND